MIALVASSAQELPDLADASLPPSLDLQAFTIGVGKVQAAISVASFIVESRPSHIICTGTCKAVDPRMDVGDIVIGSLAVDYDLDLRRFGLPRGSTRDCSGNPFGSVMLDNFLTDRAAGIEMCRGRRVWREVTIGSADRFLVASDCDKMPWIVDELHLQAVDMESYAVAAAASRGGIPVSVIRVVSDTYRGIRPKSYAAFLRSAAIDMLSCIVQYSFPNEKSPTIL